MRTFARAGGLSARGGRFIVGDVATAESSAAAANGPLAERGEAIELETHRGTRKIAVTLHYSAVRELRELLDDPRREVAGVLCGECKEDAIVVRRAAETAPAGDIIGVFRAQPGGWSAITAMDRDRLRALGLKEGVLLVVRTLAQRPWSATLFAVEADGTTAEPPLGEFPWDEYLLRHGWLLDLTPPLPPPPPQRPAPAAKPQLKAPRSWAAGAVLLLAAGAGGAAAFRWLPAALNQTGADAAAPPSATPTLALRVARQSQDLEVTWNREADAVRQARAATLTIRSGGATRVIEMRPEQLQEGRVLFRPLAGVDTDVRLEVMDSGGKPQAESVEVLGFDTAPPVPLPTPPAAKPEPRTEPAGERKLPPQQSADRDVAPAAPAHKPVAIASAPVSGRTEAVPVRRAMPQINHAVMEEMRAAKGKVTVSVQVSIDSTGRVDDATVVSSTGEASNSGPYIRLASLNAAREWRFRPATKDGRPAPSHMTLLFTF